MRDAASPSPACGLQSPGLAKDPNPAGPPDGAARQASTRRRCQNRPMRLLPALVLCLMAIAQPVLAAPPAPARILIFSKTAGFRHDSIPVAVQTLQRLA